MRELTKKEIESVAFGVDRVEEQEGKISFHRFTREQEEMYRDERTALAYKVTATAGVRLEFETNSEHLKLAVAVSKGSSRTFFVHSIFVDGKHIGELSGDLGQENEKLFEMEAALGKGNKKVKILFPWSVTSRITSLSVDDDCEIVPVKKKCTMLIFGDSITQGYDASKPELSYASQLAELLDADATNKGVGGDWFHSKLASLKDHKEPDIITVAYGTNDWSHRKQEEFEAECRAFYYNLCRIYPNAQIYALAPIWKVEDKADESKGPLSSVAEFFRKVAAEVTNMKVIDCMDFVPHDASFFSDTVHPNDKGFEAYGRALRCIQ